MIAFIQRRQHQKGRHSSLTSLSLPTPDSMSYFYAEKRNVKVHPKKKAPTLSWKIPKKVMQSSTEENECLQYKSNEKIEVEEKRALCMLSVGVFLSRRHHRKGRSFCWAWNIFQLLCKLKPSRGIDEEGNEKTHWRRMQEHESSLVSLVTVS